MENIDIEKIELTSLNQEELLEVVQNLGEKKFRSDQIYQWIHQKLASSFEDMTNLSKDLRSKLAQNCKLAKVDLYKKFNSEQDDTTKYLFEMEGNTIIECVLMRYSFGNSVCISSQAGCKMGCKFCASTIHGLERNLTAGEMLVQVYEIQKDIGERISNIVIMGSGEPLDNYDNVVSFVKLLNSEKGLEIGQRHITISTCGLTEQIYQLAQEKLQINLAISLHAPNDSIRKKLMPVAKKNGYNDLLEACIYYANHTKRRITYEYAMIQNVNSDIECANELANRLKGTLCHVNLIPINEVEENDFKKADRKQIEEFAQILQNVGVETTIRRKMGSDINAACGQLRNSEKIVNDESL